MRVDLEDLRRKKSGRKRAIWWLIAMLVLVIGAWYILSAGKEVEVEYMSVPIKRQDLIVSIQATGNLEPVQTVMVGIEVSGTLFEVRADYNDLVKKGEVLARLDTTKLEAAAKSAKGSLSVAQASLTQQEVVLNEAKRQKKRVDELFVLTNGAYPSQKEIDSAEAEFDRVSALVESAKARLEQAEADYESAVENLKKAVVLSPIDGIVLSRMVEVGQTVVATMQTPTLFKLAEDLAKMQVVVAVDEADIGDVKEGQKVLFTVSTYSDKSFEGRVKQVRLGSEIVGGVVTYNTVVEVDNADLLLRPGMTAQANIITKEVKSQLVVPNAAFRFRLPPAAKSNSMVVVSKTRPKVDQGEMVHILRDGVPVMVRVKKGDSNGLSSVIESGELNEGDLVVTGIKQL